MHLKEWSEQQVTAQNSRGPQSVFDVQLAACPHNVMPPHISWPWLEAG
jgi:hypothetical protein